MVVSSLSLFKMWISLSENYLSQTSQISDPKLSTFIEGVGKYFSRLYISPMCLVFLRIPTLKGFTISLWIFDVILQYTQMFLPHSLPQLAPNIFLKLYSLIHAQLSIPIYVKPIYFCPSSEFPHAYIFCIDLYTFGFSNLLTQVDFQSYKWQ